MKISDDHMVSYSSGCRQRSAQNSLKYQRFTKEIIVIEIALNRVANAAGTAYSRWLEDVLARTAGPTASSYAQGIQALIKGDFRVDDAVSLAA
ncbi:hypothetical protein HMPREF1979_00911 [Actinomyces johnsonii F0542]|uniref:Uncharacterized protein n=1 Tax=Actinomyces johnsonii F0542 TaxID=1321818 RepID=U1S2R3_9ACTO|nr:hypothetical protein HMPREF1979_00911 [Actinomyces johnsonii F0542]